MTQSSFRNLSPDAAIQLASLALPLAAVGGVFYLLVRNEMQRSARRMPSAVEPTPPALAGPDARDRGRMFADSHACIQATTGSAIADSFIDGAGLRYAGAWPTMAADIDTDARRGALAVLNALEAISAHLQHVGIIAERIAFDMRTISLPRLPRVSPDELQPAM